MEIKCNSVYYSYNESNQLEHIALEDVTLKIKKEQINGIVGENGSGKTTFLELISTLKCPTLGSVKIGGHIFREKTKYKEMKQLQFEIGIVLENPKYQFSESTIKQEFTQLLLPFHYQKEHLEKRICDTLKMVGLNDSYLDKDPRKLSSGETRKVAIASVLVFNPKILIFDEPTIGLDGISNESFLKMLKILKNRYHKTIIIVTQNMNVIHKISDYVFVFKNGKKIKEGTKYEIFEQEQIQEMGLVRPDIMEFSYQVMKQKGIKLGYRDDINDLIKDIYRHVS